LIEDLFMFNFKSYVKKNRGSLDYGLISFLFQYCITGKHLCQIVIRSTKINVVYNRDSALMQRACQMPNGDSTNTILYKIMEINLFLL